MGISNKQIQNDMIYFKVTIQGHQKHVTRLNVKDAEWDKNRIVEFIDRNQDEASEDPNFIGEQFDLNSEYYMWITPLS